MDTGAWSCWNTLKDHCTTPMKDEGAGVCQSSGRGGDGGIACGHSGPWWPGVALGKRLHVWWLGVCEGLGCRRCLPQRQRICRQAVGLQHAGLRRCQMKATAARVS